MNVQTEHITAIMLMLCVITLLVHSFVHVKADLLEMRRIVKVITKLQSNLVLKLIN